MDLCHILCVFQTHDVIQNWFNSQSHHKIYDYDQFVWLACRESFKCWNFGILRHTPLNSLKHSRTASKSDKEQDN